jgi:CheY-like chemotaxis protein
LRLLLAEDQEELRQLTAYLLKKEGHRVTEARNGREALRALAEDHFDVVLLDDEMPEMSGSEVVRAIRESEHKEGERQIVLALTGNTTNEDQQRLLAAGMDGFLGKPLRGEELRQKLAEVSHGRLTAPESAATAITQPAKADLLKRVGGNARLLQQIVRTFRKDSLKKLAQMKRALARRDGIALATAAHALKGSASLFGSDKATQGAQRLQEMGRKGDLGQAAAVLRGLQEAIALLREELRGYDLATRPKRTSVRKTKRKRGKTAKRSR